MKMPPINAAGLNHILHTCKPDDGTAQAIIKRNTENLIDAGIMSQQESLQLNEPAPADQQTAQTVDSKYKLHERYQNDVSPKTRAMVASNRL